VIARRGFIEPCQPSKVDRPPSGPLWVHEDDLRDLPLIKRKRRFARLLGKASDDRSSSLSI
jgi:hypothetical protein